MADRYWVGGSGTWNQTAHWSETDGGASGASVPTASDNVFFTSLSASANYTVTMVTGANCLDMNWANPSSGKPTMAGSNIAINIYGSLTFVSGMGFTFLGTINFKSTSTGKTITTAGVSLGSSNAYNIDGAGGEWTLQDNFSGFSSLNIKAGNLKTNAKSVTGGNITVSGTTTRGLDLTNSTVTLSYQWNIGSTTGFTFVNTGSSIILNSGGAYFSGGGLSYNNFTINMNYSSVQNGTSVTGNNTFVNLTLTGTNGTCREFDLFNTQTVTGTLTLTGYSQTRRLTIKGYFTGIAVTIALGTTGTAVITNVDFMDITFTGTNAPVSGTSVGDCGGNTGITFTGATTRYWVGNGGSWSDINHWSASSNGAGGATMPLPQDTVVFNSYSITSAAQTITIDIHKIKVLDFSGVSNTPNLTLSCDLWIFGNVDLTGTGTYNFGDPDTYAYGMQMMGRGSYTLKSASKDLYDFAVNAPSGTVTLQDNLTITDVLQLLTGTFTVGAHDIRALMFYGDDSTTVNMGSGTWTLFGSDNGEWSTEGSCAVNCQTSIIKLTNEIGGTVYFLGGSKTFYTVWLTGNNGGAEWSFDYNNTFNTFKDDNNYAHQITFAAGTTQHITNWQVSGVAGQLIKITSDSIAVHYLVKDGGGIVNADYLDIQHSVATPASTWYAGTTSTDHQAVATAGSGWLFVNGSLRTQIDNVFLGASRITTMGKWLPRNMADSVMVGASRVASLGRDAATFTRALADNILRGADRLIKMPAMSFMAMSDYIMNGVRPFTSSYSEGSGHGAYGWPLYPGSAYGIAAGQSFKTPVTGSPVWDKCKFYLEKIGDVTIPTGNMYACLYAHTGTFGSTGKATGSALATSDLIDVTTVLTSPSPNPALITFNFTGANRIKLDPNTAYVVVVFCNFGDSTYHIILCMDASGSQSDPGNMCYSTNGSTFYSQTYDSPYYAYGVGRTDAISWFKTFFRAMTDLIMAGASRLVNLTRTGGIFTRAMTDNITVGASRVSTSVRVGKFIRNAITNIAVAAWGIPTMGMRTVREMADSIMRGASRVAGLSRDAMNFIRGLTHSTLINGTVANTSHFIREMVATLYTQLSSLFGAIWQIKPISVLVKTIRSRVLRTKDLSPDIRAKDIRPDTSIKKIIINSTAETKNPSVKIKITSPNIGTKTIKPDINNKKPI